MYQTISEAYVGKHYTELPTPALLLDLDVLEFNLQTMKDFLTTTKCDVRPHVKAHKCPSIAHLQIAYGAIGVTCAKLGEAEVMAHSGIKSILLANQVIGEGKIKVLCGLNKYSEVMPAIDTSQNADEINEIAGQFNVVVPVVIEVDSGINRAGVRTVNEAVALAKHITTLKNLKFKGIQAYEGAFRGLTWEEKEKKCNGSWDIGGVKLTLECRKAIEDAGIPVEIVSCASTGTYDITAKYEGVTEIQPGSYAVMENAYYRNDVFFPFKQALSLVCSVCSVYKPRKRIVIDAGKKSTPYDQGLPTLIEDPEAVLTFHEEHCLIDTTDKLADIKAGDKLRLAPSHCCTTANQNDYYYCIRNGIVESIWTITARGRYE